MDYIIIFLEGIITFISPCILPMIPIYISYFMGQQNNISEKSTEKALINAVAFVLGFTAIFTIFGVLSASLGSFVKEYLQYINIVLGIIIIVFGINFIGLINIPAINKTAGINIKTKSFTFVSSFVFGIVFGVSWSPCVGTFLGVALSIIAVNGDIIRGITLIIVYCLGLGIPFIFSTFLVDKLTHTFDYIKSHYKIITKICGAFLCIIGILMITGLIDKYFELVG